MLRVKAKELSIYPEFKESWLVLQLEASSLHLHENEDQSCSASPSQHGRQGRRDSSICPEILRSRQCWGYDLRCILNMGETPMRFELPATRTLEFIGSRTVPVFSCGADKQSFTVALTVKANGEKLPLKVIFKGVRQLNINMPPRMQISVHKKGWMDEEGMFYLHTVCSEKKPFERVPNTILRIRNEVRTIVLLLWICY